MVVVDTNLTPGRDFDTLRIREGSRSEDVVTFHYGAEGTPTPLEPEGQLPFTLSVQNRSATIEERAISVTAWKGGEPVFARTASFVVPEGSTRELRMTVDALCFDTRRSFTEENGVSEEPWARRVGDWAEGCAAGESCLAGRCRPTHLDAERLPTFEPTSVFGGLREPNVAGRCVDLVGCFADSQEAGRLPPVWVVPRPTPVGCLVDIQGGINDAETFTVAHEVVEKNVGTCSPLGCMAWLERATSLEIEPGWVQSGNRIVLPDALCDQPTRRVYIARERTATCAVKNRATPRCAPWSSVGPRPASDIETRLLSVDGTRDSETICAIQTPSATLCTAAKVSCGDILAPDPLCADRLLEDRFAHCGACKGDTSGMVRIPGGLFRMGSTKAAVDAGNGLEIELPIHLVRVADFWMDRTEVTVGAYRDCVDAGACALPTLFNAQSAPAYNYGAPDRDNHPINGVTWFDANQFCGWRGARLPTEEEFEYAARSGAREYLYPWGNSLTDEELLCWSGRQRRSLSCAVGSFPRGANEWGVVDLVGNMHEWTASGASPSYDKARSTKQRIDRGGGWPTAQPSLVRANKRGPNEPRARSYQTGFRCVRD